MLQKGQACKPKQVLAQSLYFLHRFLLVAYVFMQSFTRSHIWQSTWRLLGPHTVCSGYLHSVICNSNICDWTFAYGLPLFPKYCNRWDWSGIQNGGRLIRFEYLNTCYASFVIDSFFGHGGGAAKSIQNIVR